LVLDEGGMVDTERFKKAGRPVAVVGTGEKGYTNIDLIVICTNNDFVWNI